MIINVPAICKVYAALIMEKRKTIDQVKENLREGTMIALCVRKIKYNKITLAAVLGESPDAEKYKDDICTGYGLTSEDVRETIIKSV